MEKCGNLLLPQFEAAISKSAGHGVGFSETKISCPAPKPQVHRSEKGKWGPVVRMSNMIKRDEKNSIVKAQELKQIQNLEVAKVKTSVTFQNSFACLDNELLVNTADKAGLTLGLNPNKISHNININ